MAEHVEIGHAILIAAELPTEAHWVLHHHERYDGGGYPARMRADGDPARVADHRRRRRVRGDDRNAALPAKAMTVERRSPSCSAHAGAQFDSRCVNALVDVVDESLPLQALLAAASRTGGRAPLPTIQSAPNTAA